MRNNIPCVILKKKDSIKAQEGFVDATYHYNERMDFSKLFESKGKGKVRHHQNIANPKLFVISSSAESARCSARKR